MKTLILLFLALGALAYFNPDMDDFKLFVEDRSEQLLERNVPGGLLGDVVSGAVSRVAGRNIDRITDRKSYVVFSTYTIDLDGEDATDEDWTFLGIAGQFIETQRPASLDKER